MEREEARGVDGLPDNPGGPHRTRWCGRSPRPCGAGTRQRLPAVWRGGGCRARPGAHLFKGGASGGLDGGAGRAGCPETRAHPPARGGLPTGRCLVVHRPPRSDHGWWSAGRGNSRPSAPVDGAGLGRPCHRSIRLGCGARHRSSRCGHGRRSRDPRGSGPRESPRLGIAALRWRRVPPWRTDD